MSGRAGEKDGARPSQTGQTAIAKPAPGPGAGRSGQGSPAAGGSGRSRSLRYTITGSEVAKKQAALILEVLSGGRGTVQAAAMIGVSLSRYYVLENRAVQGLVHGLEPRPKGKQRSPESQIASLQRDNGRLTRELARAQALVRASQRAMGVRERKREVTVAAGKRRRRQRRSDRAERVVSLLRRETVSEQTPSGPAPS